MKIYNKIAAIVMVVFTMTSCAEDYLEVSPENVISEDNLDLEQLVVSAYSTLDYRYNTGEFRDNWPFDHAPTNWCFSDIRSGDAYKGGGGVGDNPGGGMHALEIHQVFPSSDNVYNLWRALYFSVFRVNSAIRAINDNPDFENAALRIAELKVLRAHFYFEAMKNFGSFVYIDENTPVDEVASIENSFDADYLWGKIEGDLNAAIPVLPETQPELGRINKLVAYAYLAKAKLFQGEWQDVITNADKVIAGPYRLVDDLEKLYSTPGYGNPENVFAIQYSIDDGSEFGNLDFGSLLNSPDSPSDDPNHPYLNGDDFDKPSQNIVNAFKVDANGLPLLDTYNNSDLEPRDTATPVDPRLDHSIGRPGITWKKWEPMPMQDNWNRDIATYGYYVRKKNQIDPYSDLRASGGFPWAKGALDWPIIKISDVMLWKAEAAIELNDTETGMTIINQIRNRAKNAPRVYDFNNPSVDAANYSIELYPTIGITQNYARKALRMERRLELHNEGHHFYDLVRWGEAANWINNYMLTESGKRSYYSGASFTAGRDEYLPIPQIEIDATGGVYKQRAGY
ncbi:RagB/SusD family nutrient uptake outer membrane protein [Jejuia pallidilutea]|uniref:Putative outer membrane protein n=2 Tax=Jejuia pallidilutea TaxID=504487 RepID=A0A090VLP6_9FLAO|nr:RagB/SusD family nutrient uptake outer membrane protein [Jejuia pallidilutea]GAL65695.1 putative outer membrane protein [Jejuia pallidilutea]GAL88636.1 putative outer membrane protein [Jejuia pallidilutea]